MQLQGLMLVSLGGAGLVAGLASQSLVSGLEVLSVGFVIYMVVRIAVLARALPAGRQFDPPDLLVPAVVDRDRPPALRLAGWEGDARVRGLYEAVIRKIEVAADEAAIHAFVAGRVAILRRETRQRYAGVSSDVDGLAFEGVMGTILGLMVFLAQATALFELPALGSDSSALIQAITTNIEAVDLLTVLTAFITSLIGWGARAWLGGLIDHRERTEQASLTAIEGELADRVLANLHLPAEVPLDPAAG